MADLENVNFFHPPDLNILSIEELIKIVQAEDRAKELFSNARARLENELLNGKPVDGFKLVHKTCHRKYRDLESAKKALIRNFGKGKVIEEKLVSPAVLDRLIEEKGNMREATKLALFGLVDKPIGGPVMASEDDKRKPYIKEELFTEPVTPTNLEDLF